MDTLKLEKFQNKVGAEEELTRLLFRTPFTFQVFPQASGKHMGSLMCGWRYAHGFKTTTFAFTVSLKLDMNIESHLGLYISLS